MAHDYLFRRHLNNAARAAWRWAFGQAPGADSVQYPAGRGNVDSRYKPIRRTAHAAYQINAKFVPDATEEPPIVGVIFSTTVRSPRRAGMQAYRSRCTFVPDDVLEPDMEIQRTLLPQRARGPQRSSAIAYSVFVRATNPDVDDHPVGRSSIPNRAYPARRTGSTSYWMPQPYEIPAPVQYPAGRGNVDSRPRLYRRAATAAYWFPSIYQVGTGTLVPPITLVRDRLKTPQLINESIKRQHTPTE